MRVMFLIFILGIQSIVFVNCSIFSASQSDIQRSSVFIEDGKSDLYFGTKKVDLDQLFNEEPKLIRKCTSRITVFMPLRYNIDKLQYYAFAGYGKSKEKSVKFYSLNESYFEINNDISIFNPMLIRFRVIDHEIIIDDKKYRLNEFRRLLLQYTKQEGLIVVHQHNFFSRNDIIFEITKDICNESSTNLIYIW